MLTHDPVTRMDLDWSQGVLHKRGAPRQLGNGAQQECSLQRPHQDPTGFLQRIFGGFIGQVGELVVPQRSVVDPFEERPTDVAIDGWKETHHHADQRARRQLRLILGVSLEQRVSDYPQISPVIAWREEPAHCSE